MPVFAFYVWTSSDITKCSLRLEWPFCFEVKNIFWRCKWKRSSYKMSSENYVHVTTAPAMVTVRAGWIPPVLCEYLDNRDFLPQFILWGHWSSPLPYRKKPKTKPNHNQTNIQKTHKKPPTKPNQTSNAISHFKKFKLYNHISINSTI